MQDTRRQSRARFLGWLSVLLAGLLLLTPGVFTIPPVDRDESRFAQATSQMLAGEDLIDWAVPKIQDTPRLNKPPLIYWLQAGSVSFGKATGLYEATESLGRLPTYGIGWYRLPSVICAIIAGLLTYTLALRMLGGHVLGASMAGMCLLACPMVLWDARQARADQLLLACTTLAMVGLHTVWSNRNDPVVGWRGWIALWLGIGLGVMAKGPITPMVVFLAAAALSMTGDGWGWIKRTRPMLGVLLVAALVVPWVWVVVGEVGAGNYFKLVYAETIGRSGSAAEGHWGPPGYHLVLLAVMLWPISLVVLDAVVGAFKRGGAGETGGGRFARIMARIRGLEPNTRFLLAWIIPSWVVFELISTKLPHYVLPMYPAVALLCARYVIRTKKRPNAIGTVIWFVIGFGLVIVSIMAVNFSEQDATVVYGVLIGAVVLLAVALIYVSRPRLTRAMYGGVLVVWVSSATIFSFSLPLMWTPWVTARIMWKLEMFDSQGERPLACVGYQEDSLIFSTGGRIERVGGKRAAAWLDAADAGLMVIERRKLDAVGGEGAVRVLAEVDGFNYSNGDWVDVLLVERRPDREGGG